MHIAHRSLSFWSHRSAVLGARSLPSLLAALIWVVIAVRQFTAAAFLDRGSDSTFCWWKEVSENASRGVEYRFPRMHLCVDNPCIEQLFTCKPSIFVVPGQWLLRYLVFLAHWNVLLYCLIAQVNRVHHQVSMIFSFLGYIYIYI